MVGLVFIDKLRLTPAQWAALGLNAAGWLWHVCHSRVDASRPPSQEAFWLTAGLTFSALWTAFWNTPTCVDAWLLFQEAQHFAASGWGALLAELPQRPYVNYQTPFLTFWFSRAPALWFHQLIWFPLALLCAGLMQQLYGRAAALLLATPVFALMIHQPSPDVLLFAVLLIVLRLRQMGQRGLAAWVYGLTWLLKPLTILTAPLILPQLGLAGLGSLAMWGGYVLWSQQWEFGRQQCRFLLQQVFLQSLLNPGGRNNQRMPLTLAAKLQKIRVTLWQTLAWRWDHLGRNALQALPFYLCPVWFRPCAWQGIALAVVIVMGYGNSKDLLLDLLFLFPVNPEEKPHIS